MTKLGGDVGAVLLLDQLRCNYVPRPVPLSEAERWALPAVKDPPPPGDSAQALVLLIRTLFRPLATNIIDHPGESKYGAVRRTQPWMAFALTYVHGAEAWLTLAGFEYDVESDRYVHRDGARLSSSLEMLAVVEQEAISAGRNITATMANPDHQESASVVDPRDPSGRGADRPADELLPVKRRQAEVAKQAAEHRASEAARIAALASREREELQKEAVARKAASEALAAGTAADIEAARPLVAAAKLAVHRTGRLRNSAFSASDFNLRCMRHGRNFACGASEKYTVLSAAPNGSDEAAADAAQCDDGCLEAHWHMTCGSLIYAYVAHLDASASRVLHVGPELGYQYNAIPHTEHFQRFLLASEKLVDVNGKPLRHETPNRVEETCRYCGVPLMSLQSR